MEQTTLLILGAGGHGKAVAEAALLSGFWTDIAFIDDSWPQVQMIFGLPILSNIAGLTEVASKYSAGIVAVGSNALRQKWSNLLRDAGLPLATIIHPSACVSSTANIGEGSTIMALAMVGVDVSIGECSIINAHSTVDHDAKLGDYVHLGVGVHLAGGVKIGHRAWLQVGTCVGYQVSIEDDCICDSGTILKKA